MKIALSEAADFLECSEETVMSMLRDGELPGVKPGKAWIIPREAFYAAVAALAQAQAASRAEAKRQATARGRGL